MARQFEQFTKEEFEEFLDELTGGKFTGVHKVTPDDELRFSREMVYQIPLSGTTELSIRVFSTVDTRTEKARGKGNDSIKTVIWSNEHDRPIAGKRYTQRITTWRDNLSEKIVDLAKSWDEVTEKCDQCGNWMVKREGQYGDFWGCLSYPDCDNTKQID